jgi:hypothetical protein
LTSHLTHPHQQYTTPAQPQQRHPHHVQGTRQTLKSQASALWGTCRGHSSPTAGVPRVTVPQISPARLPLPLSKLYVCRVQHNTCGLAAAKEAAMRTHVAGRAAHSLLLLPSRCRRGGNITVSSVRHEPRHKNVPHKAPFCTVHHRRLPSAAPQNTQGAAAVELSSTATFDASSIAPRQQGLVKQLDHVGTQHVDPL